MVRSQAVAVSLVSLWHPQAFIVTLALHMKMGVPWLLHAAYSYTPYDRYTAVDLDAAMREAMKISDAKALMAVVRVFVIRSSSEHLQKS